MKELNTSEIAYVSGAGTLQTGLKQIGEFLGTTGFNLANSLLNSSSNFTAEQGKEFGGAIGNALGERVEKRLSTLPVLGNFFKTLFGI